MDDVTQPSSSLPVLAGGEPGETAAPLLDRLRIAVSRRLASNLPVPASMAQWLDEETDAFADDSELLGVLFDQLLHAHALDTATAGAAALLADVVIDSQAAAAVRAALTVTLAEAATAALREALDPQGFVSTEAVLRQQTDSERAVRQAVRGETARLFAQWDEEPEVMQFALAVLAAACVGTDVITRIASLAAVWPEIPRAATLALACALAADNEEAIAEALGETVRHPDYNPDAQGDPEALVQSRGLSLLIDLAQQEIGPLVFH